MSGRAVPPVPPPIVFSATGRWTPDAQACAVAVGNFDGVHVGHAAIVERLLAAARDRGLPTVAFTFDPHPASIVRPEAAPAPLTTPRRRSDLLAALGVDAVLVQPADADLVALEAEAFYGEILRGRLRAAALVEGADFRFGARRRGDMTMLASLCAADGVFLETVPPVVRDGASVSSSRLRQLIGAGRIGEANGMLTAAYRCTGRVIEGAKRGRTIGFPTANLAGIATLLPAGGVYAARATADGDDACWPAAVHIGPNVSFGETSVSVEAHLIGFAGNLYGRTLHIDFLDRLRETRKFASTDELKAQLAIDAERAAATAARPAIQNTPAIRSTHAT
jgi:riboflavin kinase/FMN adenylyltransferase